MEARAAFNRTGMPSLPSTQNPVKMDVSSVPPISGPPPSSLPSIPSGLFDSETYVLLFYF